FPPVDLSVHGRIASQQQLLACLPFGVEGPRYQHPSERAVVKQPSVFPCKGNSLGHTLVDDIPGHLSKAVGVGLPGAIIASLDGIVEEAVVGVPIPLIVLGGVDPSLSRNGMRPSGRILVTEGFYVVSQLCKGRRSTPP